MNTIALPIAFAATNCTFVATAPNGTEQYWSADVKAVRRGLFVKIFSGILFVETPGEMAFLAGIESADGVDRHIKSEAAAKQLEFITFLREENKRNDNVLGLAVGLFQREEYEAEGKATAAYMAARSLTHTFGVGYTDSAGQYNLIGIVPGDDSGFDGTRYVPFEQLGE